MGRIREILSGANKTLSSKRITGVFCIVSATCVILFLALTDPTFPSINGLLECVLFTGGGLLGLGLAERRFTSSDDSSSNEETTTKTKTTSSKAKGALNEVEEDE